MKNIVVRGLKTAMLESAVVKKADIGPGTIESILVTRKKKTGMPLVAKGQIALTRSRDSLERCIPNVMFQTYHCQQCTMEFFVHSARLLAEGAAEPAKVSNYLDLAHCHHYRTTTGRD